jgi:hypothetical protein
MPDCNGWETLQETNMILLPTKWNKNKEGAWRMDLPVDIKDTYDDGCEDEINNLILKWKPETMKVRVA